MLFLISMWDKIKISVYTSNTEKELIKEFADYSSSDVVIEKCYVMKDGEETQVFDLILDYCNNYLKPFHHYQNNKHYVWMNYEAKEKLITYVENLLS